MANIRKTCSSCQCEIVCSSNKNCWCMGYPPILPLNIDDKCMCPNCLKTKIKQAIKVLLNNQKFQKIAALGPVKSPIEDIDYSINEEGNVVFTDWYHLRRGYCCGSGCKNCPFDELDT